MEAVQLGSPDMHHPRIHVKGAIEVLEDIKWAQAVDRK